MNEFYAGMIEASLVVYGLVTLLTLSRATRGARGLFRRVVVFPMRLIPAWKGGGFLLVREGVPCLTDGQVDDYKACVEANFDVGVGGTQTGYDFITCQMCLGIWASIGAGWFYGDWGLVVPVFALSYFMSALER